MFNWFKKKEPKKKVKKDFIYNDQLIKFRVGKVDTIIYFKDDREPIKGPVYTGYLTDIYHASDKEIDWHNDKEHPTNDNMDIEKGWDVYTRSIHSEFSQDEFYSAVIITPIGMVVRKDDIKEIKGLHDPNFEVEYKVNFHRTIEVDEDSQE